MIHYTDLLCYFYDINNYMDLSKVRLVVTDMDGTLLNSKGEVSKDFFILYEELKKHNVRFVAASGRPHQSITNKITSIQDEITIISENGAYAKQGYEELLMTNLYPSRREQIIPDLRNIKDAYTVLCGKKYAYLETKDERFINVFKEYYAEYLIVDDLTKVINDDFLKIAIYHFSSSETHIYPTVRHLEKEMQVKVSGEHWVDLSESNANKGFALNFVQEKLGITKEETMVFGDYNNDLEMLKEAYFSYAMDNAHSNVKKTARFKTKSNDEQGVEIVLKELLKAKNSI